MRQVVAARTDPAIRLIRGRGRPRLQILRRTLPQCNVPALVVHRPFTPISALSVRWFPMRSDGNCDVAIVCFDVDTP
jgi:hypothetical protein